MGFGTPSRTESQQTSSGPSVATQVSPSTVLYGDHEGLEHPQILETDNTGEQEIQYLNTGNLGEQLTSGVKLNSEFLEQIAETSDLDASCHENTMQEIRQLEEKKLQELVLLRAEKKGTQKTSLDG